MTSEKLGKVLKINTKFVAPIMLGIILILLFWYLVTPEFYEDFPELNTASHVMGWILLFSPLVPIVYTMTKHKMSERKLK